MKFTLRLLLAVVISGLTFGYSALDFTSLVSGVEAASPQATVDYADEVEGHSESGGGHGSYGALFLGLAILLVAGKLGGFIEKFGQPGVLGELLSGIGLSLLAYLGISQIADLRHDSTIAFIAEIGAVILLFQIGLESNIKSLMKVGVNALMVALIGVILPFLAGTFLIGPVFFKDASFVAHLFIGASMVATSVGITAAVFKNLRILSIRASQTVLGAAVIDDVLGLLVLAIVSAIASGGEVTAGFVARLSLQAFAFLGLAIVLGTLVAKPISKLLAKIHSGHGMKLSLAIGFALIYAYIATLVGLAPIVGAFAAGLVLDAVHFNVFSQSSIAAQLKRFRDQHKLSPKAESQLNDVIHHQNHIHVEDMVANVSFIFVPMFFAFTGLQIEIESLLNPHVYLVAGIASVVAILGKLAAGLGAKGGVKEKLLVGMAMVPRGEVGLIFASIGKALGAINAEQFSTIVLVVIVTTFIAPPLIKKLAQSFKAETADAKALA